MMPASPVSTPHPSVSLRCAPETIVPKSTAVAPVRVTLVGFLAGGHSGVPRYAAALASAVDAVAPDFPELEFTLLTTRRGAVNTNVSTIAVKEVAPHHRLSERLNEGPARIAAEQQALRRVEADLVHFFDVAAPLSRPRLPFVTTLHDVALRHPTAQARFTLSRRLYKRLLYATALRRACAVVAVSAFAKSEGLRYYRLDPDRIRVIHSGPGLSAGAAGPQWSPDLESPYLLYVGNITANKNLPFLVRAFSRMHVETKLVLAGRPLGDAGDVMAAIDASSRRERIEVVPAPSDEVLDRLYAGASALVLPSVYEGFGFTPLEAMARGCPVVASAIPALEEVLDGGALLLPLEEERWAAALDRVVREDALRTDLHERGLETVATYSWQTTARELCRLFLTLGDEGVSAAR